MNILSAIIICAVIAVAGFVVYNSHGIKTNSAALSYETEVEGNQVTLQLKAKAQNERIARVKFTESDGGIQAFVYTAPKLFLANETKEYSYSAKDEVMLIKIDKDTVWEDGVHISTAAAELYQNKNAYIGDNSKDLKIAEILGIQNEFGDFTNELKTDETPYEWIITLNDKIPASKEAVKMQKMKDYASVLIAEVDNLDKVTFKYQSSNKTKEVVITKDEASELAGSDIKNSADSAKTVQELLDGLGI